MIPLGFSGGSQDRLMVLAVAAIRWTVGTADGAAERGETNEGKSALFIVFCIMSFQVLLPFVCPQKTKYKVLGCGLGEKLLANS